MAFLVVVLLILALITGSSAIVIYFILYAIQRKISVKLFEDKGRRIAIAIILSIPIAIWWLAQQ
jgi:hypothetical protein